MGEMREGVELGVSLLGLKTKGNHNECPHGALS